MNEMLRVLRGCSGWLDCFGELAEPRVRCGKFTNRMRSIREKELILETKIPFLGGSLQSTLLITR